MMSTMPKKKIVPAINNPFAKAEEIEFSAPDQVDYQPGPYEDTLHQAHEIIQNLLYLPVYATYNGST